MLTDVDKRRLLDRAGILAGIFEAFLPELVVDVTPASPAIEGAGDGVGDISALTPRSTSRLLAGTACGAELAY